MIHLQKTMNLIIIGVLFLFASCNEENNSIQERALRVTSSPPSQIVLTWQQDPSTTMTITWRTNDLHDEHLLRYSPNKYAGYRNWNVVNATSFSFEETSAWLHTVELTGLKPNQEYHVIIEHPTEEQSFSFRTLPNRTGTKELTILAGGDSRTQRNVRREMNAMAIAEDPDFVIFDGDFINDALNEQEWDEWFDDWHEQMITFDGRRIPIVTSIGNHEIAGGFLQPVEHAPFFINRFITPQPRTYYALEMGPDLVLITLDSDHIYEVTSQNNWLDSTLYAHQDKRWKIVQYHVAAWPSVRDFNGDVPAKIRENWIPIMEKHNVNLVIEAHDHAFKKTVPIRNNQRDDENGIVYIGDGGWGAPLRQTKNPDDYWWLEEALMVDHFWKISISKDGSKLQADPVFKR
jgi:acid phosphatase type 7